MYTLERSGFKHIVAKLNPYYEIPSMKHFSKYELRKLYNPVRESIVKPKLMQAEHFSAATDLWTSSAMVPFMSLTVHFVDNEWSLQSFCLATFPLCENHTGLNLSEAVSNVIAHWDLKPDQLVATTTDNASNIVAGFRSLGWMQVSWFGHNLNLAISKSLNLHRVNCAPARCLSPVERSHCSWLENCDLCQMQELLNLPQLKLIASVVTRWDQHATWLVLLSSSSKPLM